MTLIAFLRIRRLAININIASIYVGALREIAIGIDGNVAFMTIECKFDFFHADERWSFHGMLPFESRVYNVGNHSILIDNFDFDAGFNIAIKKDSFTYSSETVECDLTGLGNDEISRGCSVMQRFNHLNAVSLISESIRAVEG